MTGKSPPLLLALSDIKIAHSVFALPFAILAAVIAAPIGLTGVRSWPAILGPLAMVIACMVFARTWAMLINRLADWRFDRDNPRTARRAIASGRLAPRDAALIAAAAAAAFILCAAGFLLFFANPWPLILALPVLAWIALYSFTKRFTLLCHLFLGGALAASPIAASIAINPAVIAHALSLSDPFAQGLHPAATPGAGLATLLLAAFVLLWVAGFDVAYALQDIDFDRRAKLRSIPAALGSRGALWVARALHAEAFLMLLAAAAAEPAFGPIFNAAVALIAALLIYEHIVLTKRGVAGLPLAFFTLNGFVSLTLGAAGVIDLLIP